MKYLSMLTAVGPHLQTAGDEHTAPKTTVCQHCSQSLLFCQSISPLRPAQGDIRALSCWNHSSPGISYQLNLVLHAQSPDF